jgi:hypothetical protein
VKKGGSKQKKTVITFKMKIKKWINVEKIAFSILINQKVCGDQSRVSAKKREMRAR